VIELETALRSLTANKVDFVFIGGAAITAYVTQDLDFCYSRTPGNLARIVAALAPFKPRLRGFPEELPFFWDERTLLNGTNFTLITTLGSIDLLGEVPGVGNYDYVSSRAVEMQICEINVRVISLDDLIDAKRTAGRTKDQLVLPELEALREALDPKED